MQFSICVWHTKDNHEVQFLNTENSQLSAELDCAHSDSMHVNHLTDKCKYLEFSIASLEQERNALQETNEKLNDKISELHW